MAHCLQANNKRQQPTQNRVGKGIGKLATRLSFFVFVGICEGGLEPCERAELIQGRLIGKTSLYFRALLTLDLVIGKVPL
ncbi:hypothetical protein CA598_28690 [Paenibacillus sp. VTT E-133291]|nr:hypothetical protein CA598_28690 [Paenibacillus sp. VTT E-133291]